MQKTSLPPLFLEEYISVIGRHPLFCLLTQEDIHELALLIKEKLAEAGEIITQEGDFVNSIYFIASGSATVTRAVITVEKTKIIRIATLHADDTIGLAETGFFSQRGTCTATVTASTPMRLLSIDLTNFQRFLQKPGVAYPALKNSNEKFLFMSFLHKTNFFKQLSKEKIQLIAKKVSKISIKANTVLFNEGDQPHECYFLLSGKIAITSSQNKTEYLIMILEPPDIFGESAFIKQGKRNATATAKEDCELFVLEHKQFQLIIEDEKRGNLLEPLISIRIEQIRPARLPEIVLTEKLADNNEIEIISANTHAHAKIRLSAEEYLIWKALDGKTSLGEIINKNINYQNKMSLNEVYHLVLRIASAGFLKLAEEETPKESRLSFIYRIKNYLGLFYGEKNKSA